MSFEMICCLTTQPKCIWNGLNWSPIWIEVHSRYAHWKPTRSRAHMLTLALACIRPSIRLQFWTDLNILLQFLQAPFNASIQIKKVYIELIEMKCWMPCIHVSLNIESKICINIMFYISFYEWIGSTKKRKTE